MNWLGTFFSDWFGEWFGGAAGPPGSMSAGLSGHGALTATLSSTGTPAPVPGGGGGLWPIRALRRWLLYLARRVALASRLSGSGALRATLTATRPDRTTGARRALALLLADLDE